MDNSKTNRTMAVILAFILASSGYSVATAGAEYLGVEACAQCHIDEAKKWRGSHHDLAMQVADEETVLGNFNSAGFDYYGIRSLFFKKNGQFYVNTEDAEGKPANFEIKYTFGADPLAAIPGRVRRWPPAGAAHRLGYPPGDGGWTAMVPPISG